MPVSHMGATESDPKTSKMPPNADAPTAPPAMINPNATPPVATVATVPAAMTAPIAAPATKPPNKPSMALEWATGSSSRAASAMALFSSSGVLDLETADDSPKRLAPLRRKAVLAGGGEHDHLLSLAQGVCRNKRHLALLHRTDIRIPGVIEKHRGNFLERHVLLPQHLETRELRTQFNDLARCVGIEVVAPVQRAAGDHQVEIAGAVLGQ